VKNREEGSLTRGNLVTLKEKVKEEEEEKSSS
jgi:hypothetical protein